MRVSCIELTIYYDFIVVFKNERFLFLLELKYGGS